MRVYKTTDNRQPTNELSFDIQIGVYAFLKIELIFLEK